MALAIVRSCVMQGVLPRLVHVEVHVGGGLPSMSIVGLPATAVREARDRVRAALSHLDFRVPQVRVTVNLAPADLPKHGGRFDLPIALGVLAATGQVPQASLQRLVVVGELGLDGSLRSVPGVLPMALALRDDHHALMLPSVCLAEAALAPDRRLLGVATLGAAAEALLRGDRGELSGPAPGRIGHVVPRGIGQSSDVHVREDMADVIGQSAARRALEIAAAGGHALLLQGAPGTGKSMLARRLPGLCPALSPAESLDVASIHSVAGLELGLDRWGQRPFRAPHHTVTSAALIGGGAATRPGEISLAHRGVLFLDELAEFPRRVLDALREPLETGRVAIARAGRHAEYPAAFQLVAAMNPCPCGYFGEPGRCRCGEEAVRRYQARVSGPLRDRIDLSVTMQPSAAEAAPVTSPGEGSADIRARVSRAASRQRERQGVCNARLSDGAVRALERSEPGIATLLDHASARLDLSRRGRDRVLRVARTVADLAGRDALCEDDVVEALGYRPVESVPGATLA